MTTLIKKVVGTDLRNHPTIRRDFVPLGSYRTARRYRDCISEVGELAENPAGDCDAEAG